MFTSLDCQVVITTMIIIIIIRLIMISKARRPTHPVFMIIMISNNFFNLTIDLKNHLCPFFSPTVGGLFPDFSGKVELGKLIGEKKYGNYYLNVWSHFIRVLFAHHPGQALASCYHSAQISADAART